MKYLPAMLLLSCVGLSIAQDAFRFRPWSGDTPPLVLKDLDGKLFDLSKYRGKVVIVNFMATWCGPCVEEMPSLQKLREQFRGKGLEVIAVNTGESEAKVSQFAQNLRIKFPVLLDPDEEVKAAWKVYGIPATFIVGTDGKIAYRVLGEIDWLEAESVSLIESLLPEEQKIKRASTAYSISVGIR
ncbi:MAG: TlpA disulfide reductase family protein [Burkholderiales bacterium]